MPEISTSELKQKPVITAFDQSTGHVLKVIAPNGFQVGVDDANYPSSGLRLPSSSTPALTGSVLYNENGTLKFDGATIGGGGSGGAPTDAQYITLATDGDLSAERVLTAGTGISSADAGAGSTLTLALDVNELSALGTTAATSDYVVIEDVTDNSTKKVLISNLPASLAGGGWTDGDPNLYVSTATDTVAIGQASATTTEKLLVKVADSENIKGVFIDFDETGNYKAFEVDSESLTQAAIASAGYEPFYGIMNKTGGSGLRIERNLGEAGSQPLVHFKDFNASNTQTTLKVTQAGAGDILNLFDDATEVFTVLDGGNVGIGVTDPDTPLEVLSTSTQQKWSYDSDSYATLAVGASSATTLAIGESGNLTIDVGGDIILDAAGETIYFKDSGTERIKFNLDNSPQIDVTGDFTIDGSADIILDAAGGNLLLKNNTATYFDINLDSTPEIDVTGDFRIDGSGTITLDATGDIIFQDAGSEVMRIEDGGQVGIGVSDPDAQLEVLATDDQLKLSYDGTHNTIIETDGSGNLIVRPSGLSFWSTAHLKPNGDNTYDLGASTSAWKDLYLQGDIHFTDAGMIKTDAGDLTVNAVGGDIIFQDNGSEVMRIEDGGNVGIGVSNPTLKLHVNRSSATPTMGLTREDSAITADESLGTFYFGGSEDSGSTFDYGATIQAFAEGAWTVGSDIPTYLVFSTVPDGSSTLTERMRISAEGLVGIGVTDPDTPLEVLSTSTQLKLSYDGSYYTSFAVGGTGDLTITPSSAGAVSIGAALRPTTDNTFDLGSASLAWRHLHLQGNITFQDDATIKTSSGDLTVNAVGGDIIFQDNGSEVMRIEDGGNVGIGFTDPEAQLDIRHTDTTTWSASGDAMGIEFTDFLVAVRNNTIVSNAFAGIAFDVSTETDPDTIGAAIACVNESNLSALRDNSLAFATNPAGDDALREQMRISHTGNVGIGSVAPDKRLEINGVSGDCLRLTYNTIIGSATNYTDFEVSSGGDLTITPSGGSALKPVQPAFATYINSDQSNIAENTWTTVQFDAEVYDIGSNFNTTTYTFTAPTTGKYSLHANIRIGNISANDDQYVWGKIVTSNRSWYGGLRALEDNATHTWWTVEVTAIADMDASDTAYVQVKCFKGTTTDITSAYQDADDVDCSFSGYLLG